MGWEIERQVISSDQDLLKFRLNMIESLQRDLEEAGKVCTRLNSENVSLQEQCSQLLDKQYQDDYRFENQKKMFANLNKTLERYEKENKAMRELLALWI